MSDHLQPVTCPACGMLCSLVPLARVGDYRLVDEDGDSHGPVCQQLEPGGKGRGWRRKKPLMLPVPDWTRQCSHGHSNTERRVRPDGKSYCARCKAEQERLRHVRAFLREQATAVAP